MNEQNKKLIAYRFIDITYGSYLLVSGCVIYGLI